MALSTVLSFSPEGPTEIKSHPASTFLCYVSLANFLTFRASPLPWDPTAPPSPSPSLSLRLTFSLSLVQIRGIISISSFPAQEHSEEFLSEVRVEPAIDEGVVAHGRHRHPMANEENGGIMTRWRELEGGH